MDIADEGNRSLIPAVLFRSPRGARLALRLQRYSAAGGIAPHAAKLSLACRRGRAQRDDTLSRNRVPTSKGAGDRVCTG